MQYKIYITQSPQNHYPNAQLDEQFKENFDVKEKRKWTQWKI